MKRLIIFFALVLTIACSLNIQAQKRGVSTLPTNQKIAIQEPIIHMLGPHGLSGINGLNLVTLENGEEYLTVVFDFYKKSVEEVKQLSMTPKGSLFIKFQSDSIVELKSFHQTSETSKMGSLKIATFTNWFKLTKEELEWWKNFFSQNNSIKCISKVRYFVRNGNHEDAEPEAYGEDDTPGNNYRKYIQRVDEYNKKNDFNEKVRSNPTYGM